MTRLLDGNVLVATALQGHVHHERVRRGRRQTAEDEFATCAVTEGSLLRMHMQRTRDQSAGAAWSVLSSLHDHPRHVFWTDGFSYLDLSPARLTGHRQVTDSWLAELARRKGGNSPLLTNVSPSSGRRSPSSFRCDC